MKVLGISPLDKDATASLVEDGRVLFAAGEERFTRTKYQSGFPYRAIEEALRFTGTRLDEIDAVAYAFLSWDQELACIQASFAHEQQYAARLPWSNVQRRLAAAERHLPARDGEIPGLHSPNERMAKPMPHRLLYRVAGATPGVSRLVARRAERQWQRSAAQEHRHWQRELERGLSRFGLGGKLRRFEHHLSHAANAYLTSGYERALIITVDGYGTGLAGSVSLGEGGRITRLQSVRFPNSLGAFYETVTSALGFKPDRHAGKIVGLAAYGDPRVLGPVLLDRIHGSASEIHIEEALNIYLARHLASRFPKIDVAAAYQWVLETVVQRLVQHWVRQTGCDAVVLSGGVTANVKMNQRVHEVDGVQHIFVYPNMGDGGCGTGLALHMTWTGMAGEFSSAYLGPEYSPAEIRAALDAEQLSYSAPPNLAVEAARRIHAGDVVARFDGRMEYGPRALGNRSILYHGRDPGVNQWLNQRLGRTEFMPFAPVTLWEARERCYAGICGAEHAAEFMTITFNCTAFMREVCPAAVHVDNTARPQLIRPEVNPGYYQIVREYERLSGSPSMINTSFNMHEEPIVCTPTDAVRAFLLGHLDAMIAGPYLVEAPRRDR